MRTPTFREQADFISTRRNPCGTGRKTSWSSARAHEADLGPALEAFLGAFTPGAKSIGPVRLLKTAHKLSRPLPRASSRPWARRSKTSGKGRPTGRSPQWGFMYFFTGDDEVGGALPRRDGGPPPPGRDERQVDHRALVEYLFCPLESLPRSGSLSTTILFFDMKDRQIIDDVLYGYTMYIQDRPYLDRT